MRPDAPVPRLLPADEANARLLAQVHPADWVNPVPAGRYHLVVVGAGTGGLVTAAIAAGLGARVALVERHLMGGDCLNVGCVPSKAVLRAARAWAGARGAAAAFGGPAATGDGDFAAVMRRMRELRARIAPVDGAPRYRDLGIDVFLGEGRFTGRDTLAVGGATLRFRRAVIATGARAAVPPVPGLAEAAPRTNETIFELETRPARLAVIGGGPIGSELAQAFARLGTRVTLVNRDARLLPRDDARAAAIVEQALAADGVRMLHGAEIERVELADGVRRLRVRTAGGAETVEAEELLVAAGRAPNVEGLGLEAAGIAYTPRGVTVDDRLRTSNRAVFAVGDVASPFQFTHAADAQARLVVANALFGGLGGGRASRLVIPWATYTSPEVAHVGLTAAEAARRADVETLTLPLHEVDRAILDGEEAGFATVHVARRSGRLLGATVVAEHAADLLAEFTLAVTHRLSVSALSRSIHPYPTTGAVAGRLADLWRRQRFTPRARALFRAWFRLTGGAD